MKQSSKAERKRAEAMGISVGELKTLEILEEIRERVRWAQILGYATQYLLKAKGLATDEELDVTLQAVARSLDLDPNERRFQDTLREMKQTVERRDRDVNEGRKIQARQQRKRRRKKS